MEAFRKRDLAVELQPVDDPVDHVASVPEIEADGRAVFGLDLQPCAFAADAPAVVQRMTQQRAALSARLVPRLNMERRDFQRRATGQRGAAVEQSFTKPSS